MAYESIPNETIIAKIAVRSFLTPYDMRMAAGERITQQAEEIARLRSEITKLLSENDDLEGMANTLLQDRNEARTKIAKLREALHNIVGQVEQARDRFDVWSYNKSISMNDALIEARAVLAAQEGER